MLKYVKCNHNLYPLLSDHLPRYLWGPPPPYSQPPSIENIREASENTSDITSSVTNNNPSGNSELSTSGGTVSLPVQVISGPASVSGSARTTRSGLLQNIKGRKISKQIFLFSPTLNNSSERY